MRSRKSAERRRSLITGILSLAIFLALHPIVFEYFSIRFLGGAVGDGGLYVWLVQSFINDPVQALTFETNALYPYPETRAWSDLFFLPSIIALFLTHVGFLFPAAYNSVILLTFASNAVACSLLAQRAGITPLFSAVVGILFANSSYIVGNLGHPQLLFFFWIPLAWWCVLPGDKGKRVASRHWALAGLCVTGAFFCAVYYAIFAAIGLAIIWARDTVYWPFSARRALRTLLFASLGAAPILYALPPYLAVQRLFGTRGFHEAEHFAASGLSYISFTPLHDLFGSTSLLSHSEAYLSPGYTIGILALATVFMSCWQRSRILTIALVMASISLAITSSLDSLSRTLQLTLCTSAWLVLIGTGILTARHRLAMYTLAIIFSVFLIFSFGPGGNPHNHESVFAPLGFLFSKVPGLSAVRAVGRYGSVVILGALIAAATLLQRLVTHNQQRAVAIPPFAAATLFLIFGLLENLVTTIPFDTPTPPAQALYALTSDSRAHGSVVILPFATPHSSGRKNSWSNIALLNSRYALWESMTNNQNISLVNGYSGQRSKIQLQLPRATQDFPDLVSLDYFARICGLKYIVVVPYLYQSWDSKLFSEKLSTLADAFTAVQQFEDGSMLLTLANRSLHAENVILPPFFAPRDTAVRFVLTPTNDDTCSVTAASLGRSARGSPITLQSANYLLTREQSITVAPPSQLSLASPHVIQWQVHDCAVSTRCEIPTSPTTR